MMTLLTPAFIISGKVDVCLFDKTGTLTTDELVAAGAMPWPSPGTTTGTTAKLADDSPLGVYNERKKERKKERERERERESVCVCV